MQQNLNPKEKKTQQEAASLKSAKWARASGIWAPAAASSFLGLKKLAGPCCPMHTARPQLKNPFETFGTPWKDVTDEKWPSPTFLEKKSQMHWTESRPMAGNDWS